MPKILEAEHFLHLAENCTLIDVRSPSEYEIGHIPKAINIPIFDNNERALVGTRYKHSGKECAVELGLEIVGPKLALFVKQAKKIAPNKKIMIHCWRGGMRSSSMAWLLETAGFETSILKGGYKSYRGFIRAAFANKPKLVVLGGFTGSGKTEILKSLENIGEQFLDLEGLANHKGSAFGGIGQANQLSNEQFENSLADKWQRFNLNKTIWIEDESRTIGANVVPPTLFDEMRQAPVIRINLPKVLREKRLVKEYACLDKKLLLNAINCIKKRLGGLRTTQAIEALDKEDYQKVAELTLTYYDSAYLKGLETRDSKSISVLNVEKDNPKETAKLLIQFIQ